MRILVIEDESDVADFIAKGLMENGFAVDIANDGQNGLFLATEEAYDVVVLDRMLPKISGLSLLKLLRENDIQVPVLILSALGDVDNRVEGLRSGADDYMVKPFSISELVARIHVLLKRSGPFSSESSLQVADLTMDLLTRRVERQGKLIELKPREFQLLEYMMRHAGQVVTRTMILEHVWDYNFDPQTNVIDVHISRLRKKLNSDFEGELLHTVRGAGYRLGNII
ncbi:response regulator transcription factor [Curvivirga sp.]|uniref:response regulator transcription factor n=1 Tax=Curvivirga sp. TaxID=2856848 RepID=UPI003B5A86E9